jgi:hypothetical protein
VGRPEGLLVGCPVGCPDGDNVGREVGVLDGSAVGCPVGELLPLAILNILFGPAIRNSKRKSFITLQYLSVAALLNTAATLFHHEHF